MARMIQNLIQKAQRYLSSKLTARSFRLPPHFDELRDDCIAMIALNFNAAVVHGAAGSAALFELGRERLHVGNGERQPGNRRYALARPALRLSTHPDGRGLRLPGSASGTHAFAYWLPAIGAQAGDAG
jgi:hypothetical protein